MPPNWQRIRQERPDVKKLGPSLDARLNDVLA